MKEGKGKGKRGKGKGKRGKANVHFKSVSPQLQDAAAGLQPVSGGFASRASFCPTKSHSQPSSGLPASASGATRGVRLSRGAPWLVPPPPDKRLVSQ